MATVRGILMTLPGDYWNHDVIWQIKETESGDIKFTGTWDEALKLPDDILSANVDVYSQWDASYTKKCKQITYFRDSGE